MAAVGAKVRLRIEDVAFGGRGVGRLPEDGRAAFVPFVLAGEEARVELVAVHRNYVEAGLLSVETPSQERVEPRCPYFGECGGCSYQHAADVAQLAMKRQQVASLLQRVGKIGDHPTVGKTVPSPATYGYRNRITVHARDGALGFFSHGPGERRLLDIEQCPIAAPEVNAALRELRARYRAGRLRDGRNYTLRAAAKTGDGTEQNRPPVFFQQTNDGAAARLLEIVRRLVLSDASSREKATRGHLIDAYCGAGFFSRALAGDFARVTGIEWDRRAVAAAQAAAGPTERYVSGDVAAQLSAVLDETPAETTTLLVDPPAEGLALEVTAAIAARPPATLIYVSCQPPTLARDLARLRVGQAGGAFELISVTPLDMFPQTAEIETVALLRSSRGRTSGRP